MSKKWIVFQDVFTVVLHQNPRCELPLHHRSGRLRHHSHLAGSGEEEMCSLCVWVNVLWKCVIYIIDVDVYDMWQKFKDLPWRLARSEQALRNHFSLRNRPGGYIPIFANVLSTVSNCWTWSILNMYMRIDIYVPGAGSPPLIPHPWSWIPQPLCWRGLGWETVFCAVCSFCPPFPFGVGWGGEGVVHAVWEYRIVVHPNKWCWYIGAMYGN